MSLPKGVVGPGWMLDLDSRAKFSMEVAGERIDLIPELLRIFGVRAPSPSFVKEIGLSNGGAGEFTKFKYQGVRFRYQGRDVPGEVAMMVVAQYVKVGGLLETQGWPSAPVGVKSRVGRYESN